MLGFFTKVLLLVITIILIRGTLPRTRIDQLTSEVWKNLVFYYIAYFFWLIGSVCFVQYLAGYNNLELLTMLF